MEAPFIVYESQAPLLVQRIGIKCDLLVEFWRFGVKIKFQHLNENSFNMQKPISNHTHMHSHEHTYNPNKNLYLNQLEIKVFLPTYSNIFAMTHCENVREHEHGFITIYVQHFNLKRLDL